MEKVKGKTHKEKEEKKEKRIEAKVALAVCKDKNCPFHGKLSTRGRKFRGYVTKKFPTRVVIEFERIIYYKKYERYAKARTKLHAHLPACLADKINVGDYVEIAECRPLSKIIHFVATRKLGEKEEK